MKRVVKIRTLKQYSIFVLCVALMLVSSILVFADGVTLYSTTPLVVTADEVVELSAYGVEGDSLTTRFSDVSINVARTGFSDTYDDITKSGKFLTSEIVFDMPGVYTIDWVVVKDGESYSLKEYVLVVESGTEVYGSDLSRNEVFNVLFEQRNDLISFFSSPLYADKLTLEDKTQISNQIMDVTNLMYVLNNGEVETEEALKYMLQLKFGLDNLFRDNTAFNIEKHRRSLITGLFSVDSSSRVPISRGLVVILLTLISLVVIIRFDFVKLNSFSNLTNIKSLNRLSQKLSENKVVKRVKKNLVGNKREMKSKKSKIDFSKKTSSLAMHKLKLKVSKARARIIQKKGMMSYNNNNNNNNRKKKLDFIFKEEGTKTMRQVAKGLLKKPPKEAPRLRIHFRSMEMDEWRDQVSKVKREPEYKYKQNSLWFKVKKALLSRFVDVEEDVPVEAVNDILQGIKVKKAKATENLEFNPNKGSAFALGKFLTKSKQLEQSKVTKVSNRGLDDEAGNNLKNLFKKADSGYSSEEKSVVFDDSDDNDTMQRKLMRDVNGNGLGMRDEDYAGSRRSRRERRRENRRQQKQSSLVSNVIVSENRSEVDFSKAKSSVEDSSEAVVADDFEVSASRNRSSNEMLNSLKEIYDQVD